MSTKPSAEVRSHAEAADADRRPVFVQVVHGRPCEFRGPPNRTAPYVLLAPIGVFLATLDVVHLAGPLLVLVGLTSANPRLSPLGGGCLPCLFFVAVAISAISYPRVGVPLAVWLATAWFVGSLELRLTMKPYCAPTTDEPPTA